MSTKDYYTFTDNTVYPTTTGGGTNWNSGQWTFNQPAEPPPDARLVEMIKGLEARIEVLEAKKKKKPFDSIKFLSRVYYDLALKGEQLHHYDLHVSLKLFSRYEEQLVPNQRFVINDPHDPFGPALAFKGVRVIPDGTLKGTEILWVRRDR